MIGLSLSHSQIKTAAGVFWFMQPLIMHSLVVGKSRTHCAAALLLYCGICTYISKSLLALREPDMDTISLWDPFMLHPVRYIHAVLVGGGKLQERFGLTSFWRVALFTLSLPVLEFTDAPVAGDLGNSYSIVLSKVASGLFSVLALYGICHVICEYRLDLVLPELVQRVVYLYCIAFFTEASTVVLDIIARIVLLLMGYNNIKIISPINRVFLTSSPRDLWHRLSVCVGYHWRKGVYTPIVQEGYSREVAALFAFTVNAMVHMLFSYWAHGLWFPVNWTILIVAFPMTSILIQDHVFGPEGYLGLSKNSVAYRVATYFLFVSSLATVLPALFPVLFLPTDLHGFASLILESF